MRLEEWEGISPRAWADAWGVPWVEAHDALGSTNALLAQLAHDGAADHTVVIAEEQSAGRGRRGAAWFSPVGCGLWLSFLAAPSASGRVLPLAAGLAAARAIEECVDVGVGIKWPNDLVVDGKKVGGILCEAADARVVIGVGLNLNEPAGGFPPELGDRAASVERFAREPLSRGYVAGALVRRLVSLTTATALGLDVELREELGARDVLAGREVASDQAGSGIARGIDGEGRLIVERPDGSRVPVVGGSVRAL